MKSAILEKGEKWYTDLFKIFQTMDDEQLKYNWLITDCICYPKNQKYEELFDQEYTWITGEELTKIIEDENFQFIWAVFSAFPKTIKLKEVLNYKLPLADGNTQFWVDEVSIQHPLAEIEIIAWDSTLTIFMSNIDSLTINFMDKFPLAEDLCEKNKRENAQIAHIEKLIIEDCKKRNIPITEEIVKKKYIIWNKLYSDSEMNLLDELSKGEKSGNEKGWITIDEVLNNIRK